MSTGGVAVPPGSGREVSVGRNTLTVKSGPEEGHTLVGMFESAIPPGGGFPFAHVHDEYEEVFYVLKGLRPSPTRHAVDRYRFERKLSQGPAVRWADRHHSLRR